MNDRKFPILALVAKKWSAVQYEVGHGHVGAAETSDCLRMVRDVRD